MDIFSLYTRVIPLLVCTAMAVANALIEEWFAVFGICRVIHADGGAEFRNALLHNIARQLNVGRTLISPGNPSGNTLAESAVGRTKP